MIFVTEDGLRQVIATIKNRDKTNAINILKEIIKEKNIM